MYFLNIEWLHLEVEGDTCDRCNLTYKNIIKGIEYIKDKYSDKSIKIILKDTKLNEKDIELSNWIKINGKPINKIIQIEEVHNYCKSCSDLVGRDSTCKAVIYKEKSYNSIPTSAIVAALTKTLSQQSKR